jgi:hypothetical protein
MLKLVRDSVYLLHRMMQSIFLCMALAKCYPLIGDDSSQACCLIRAI